MELVANNMRHINPDVAVFSVSIKTDAGLILWFDWQLKQVQYPSNLVSN